MKTSRLRFLAFLLLASTFLQVALCQSDSEDSGFKVSEVREEELETEEVSLELTSAPGIETLCVFTQNRAKIIKAGTETEVLVGMKNDGQSNVDIVEVKGSLHLPFEQKPLVQNLTALSFGNASVPVSAQATFPYIFAVSKFLQAGVFDLVGTIIYEIDGKPYQSTFYNGTIEVVEDSLIFRMESVFLTGVLISVIILLTIYIQNGLRQMTKKTKRATKAKVEVGTGAKDASLDEWLEGTAYTQSSSKPKKKK